VAFFRAFQLQKPFPIPDRNIEAEILKIPAQAPCISAIKSCCMKFIHLSGFRLVNKKGKHKAPGVAHTCCCYVENPFKNEILYCLCTK
jgi:hypothetical protein